MTENEIIRVIVKRLFKWGEYLCVPNLNSMLWWEADLVVMSKAGYLYEIECKSSPADLKNDKFKSKHKHWGTPRSQLVKYLYYAAEREVLSKVNLDEEIPAYAGLIVIDEGGRPSIVRHPKQNPAARALKMEERYKLARLGSIRFWTRDNADLRV